MQYQKEIQKILSTVKLAEFGHEVVYFSAVGPITEELKKSKIKKIICIGQKDILYNPNKIDVILSNAPIWVRIISRQIKH